MIVKRIQIGVMGVNCYLIGCEETKEAVVIDPGTGADTILNKINEDNWNIKYIINTHGHYDHIGANGAIKEATGAKILIHPEDAPMLTNPDLNFSSLAGRGDIIDGPAADKTIEEGDIIKVGKTVELKVIHTPGHTRGGISLYQQGHLITGDTLFSFSIGRTDFPGGSRDEIMDSIHSKLLNYPDETKVYPGHNNVSTISEVKEQNPFAKVN